MLAGAIENQYREKCSASSRGRSRCFWVIRQERYELPPGSLAVIEPETPLQLRNESESDVLVFAYGAPQQPADYKAEVLPDID